MAKFLSVLIPVLFISASASAGLNLGGLVGYRSNDVTSDNTAISYKSGVTGYQIGALVTYTLGDVLGLRSGLIYATKDAEGTAPSAGNAPVKIKVSYLDIPANALLMVPGLGLYGFGGIKYGIKSGSSAEINGAAMTVDITSSNMVLNAGVGYALSLGVASLAVEVEYESGITDVDNASTSLKTKGIMANLVLMTDM